MGGALGLQAMGIDQRIEYGIIESTFSDFKTIVNDYFHLNAGFSFAPFSNYLANRAGEIAEFDSNDARPIRYCENITQPILMVHGTKDNRIDIKYGRANYSKIKSIDKEFMAMEGATHTNVWKTGGDAYFKKALLFLDRQTMANIVSD